MSARRLWAAVEALADATRELDAACQDERIATRINAVPHQDELEGMTRALRSIALELDRPAPAAELATAEG